MLRLERFNAFQFKDWRFKSAPHMETAAPNKAPYMWYIGTIRSGQFRLLTCIEWD